jgi:threonine dehydrogenase-like Zn-dependent dehydrogenase
MKAIVLTAKWEPRPDFKPGAKDIEGQLTWLGSKVWRYPEVNVVEKDPPYIGSEEEVLIEVRSCGICGSDVHLAQPDDEGYMLYPGLTAFPCTLGHEFSGVVVEAGKQAIDKRTGRRFGAGEPVCSEEMLWCGVCRPCVDGYPNHCEFLEELGFTCDGAYAKYAVVNAKYLWNLRELERVYQGQDLFLAGSLIEPTSVAYNAVIERGGGIRPGDSVVVLGGGPVGLAACAILRRSGAACVILSEPNESRAQLGLNMGASHVINPLKEDFVKRVLEITEGYGAKLYLEATGLPHLVFSGIEQAIWQGRRLNATVVIVARADTKIPVTGEVFQVRRASIVGSQGHSGHGTFPQIISAMASGMDMTPLITRKINLSQVPESLIALRTEKKDCKVTVVNFDE